MRTTLIAKGEALQKNRLPGEFLSQALAWRRRIKPQKMLINEYVLDTALLMPFQVLPKRYT